MKEAWRDPDLIHMVQIGRSLPRSEKCHTFLKDSFYHGWLYPFLVKHVQVCKDDKIKIKYKVPPKESVV